MPDPAEPCNAPPDLGLGAYLIRGGYRHKTSNHTVIAARTGSMGRRSIFVLRWQRRVLQKVTLMVSYSLLVVIFE
jgi:hypothetical protein